MIDRGHGQDGQDTRARTIFSPRIEKYLSGAERAQTAREIAEYLEITTASTYSVLALMDVFGKVLKVKRGGSYYYLPVGVYSDEQISALLPPQKVKPEPRRRRSLFHSPGHPRVQESFLEEHLSTMRALASSGEGPSALAMIGLNQINAVETDVVPEAKVILRHFDVAVEEKERVFETPKNIQASDTIDQLPKTVRRLNLMQTKQLKEQLKGLPGYWRIESLEAAFTDFSALNNGSYGNIFYFAYNTNPWENSFKVTVDDSIPLEMEKPVKRLRGRRRSKYDPMIDRFIELGQDLVEIDVKGGNPSYVKSQLRRRIEDRGLNVAASSAGGFVYLERKNQRINS